MAVIALEAGEQVLMHALLLQAQGHHRIRPRQGPLQVALDRDATPAGHRIPLLPRRRGGREGREGFWQQGGRTAEHHIGSTGAEGPEVGAGHPRMQDVAHDHQAAAAQGLRPRSLGAEVARQGEQIEQPLAGMAVQAIATIEHGHPLTAGLQLTGQASGHTGAAMAHHQQLRPHRHIGAHRIEQALALAQRTGGGGEALHISRQAPGRQLKAAAGAGAGLEEEGGDQATLQGRQLAGTAGGQGAEALGQLQHHGVIVQRKGRQIEHVAVGPVAQGLRGSWRQARGRWDRGPTALAAGRDGRDGQGMERAIARACQMQKEPARRPAAINNQP